MVRRLVGDKARIRPECSAVLSLGDFLTLYQNRPQIDSQGLTQHG